MALSAFPKLSGGCGSSAWVRARTRYRITIRIRYTTANVEHVEGVDESIYTESIICDRAHAMQLRCRRSRQEASVDRSRFEPVDQRISGRKIRSDRTHATRPSPASRPRSGKELPSAAHRLTTACHQGMPTRPSRDCGRHQGMPTRPTPCLRALETRLSARGSRGRGRCPHRTRGCARSARGSARSRGVPRGRRCRWAPRQ